MANRYLVNASTNWSDTATWSETSGGTPGASVPTIDDTAIYDDNSPTGFVLDQDITVGSLICSSVDAGGFVISTTRTLNVGNNGAGVFYWRPANASTNFRVTLNLCVSDVYLRPSAVRSMLNFLHDCTLRHGYNIGPFLVPAGVTVVYKSSPPTQYLDWPIFGGDEPYFWTGGGVSTIAGTLDLTEANRWAGSNSIGLPSLNVTGKLINSNTSKVFTLNFNTVQNIHIADLEGRFEGLFRLRTTSSGANHLSGNLHLLNNLSITADESATEATRLSMLITNNDTTLPSTAISSVFPFTWASTNGSEISAYGDLISTGASITPDGLSLLLAGTADQNIDFGAFDGSIPMVVQKTAGIVSNAVGSAFVISDDSTCENIANSGTIEVPESTKLTTRYTAVGAARLEGTGTIRTERSPTRVLA